MKKLIKELLFLAITLFIFSTCSSQPHTPLETNNKITDHEVVFPLNDYLTTNDTVPYPVLRQKIFQEIDTSSFINIMDYGAVGNGSQPDDNAIAKAFDACKNGGGVLFPKNKIFLVQNLIRIPLKK